ncbi:glycolate oxidase subunit GlcE [Pseudaminobacter sp. 19-2017]|uniref:Glycolate oxidase subunit GlcE n=1 Tax=Pseudaminobacter soli (ex Zhang et al. 2022) TaxID=2831468 RepID=A0A942DWA6_9HYPH|nr:glycolate oxidase subunit GlcE [Pseudaminobacter soli]MBS3648419.1 glycolate oxidase subunit GlcE [Pseudaminobacter soli]
MTTFTPSSAAEVLDAVAWAVAEEAPVEVVGHRSKRSIGRPPQTEHAIDLSGLTGVTLYEPEELVLSARAGTPLAEIQRLLAEHNQELAFEPMDYGPLLGAPQGRGTIGGALAANLSGPRRIKAGAARDHILGVSAVSGRGEAFKSGGRVVKNVTGYDLSKAMAGSWGTLAVVTNVTFKVLPAAETETTLVLTGLLDDAAVSAMALAMGSPAEVSGAAHLPETVAARIGAGTLPSGAATLLRIEGFGPSVEYRVRHLRDLFGSGAGLSEVPAEASKILWRVIRDVTAFADGSEKPVWRVSMAPSKAHEMVMALRMETAVEAYYEWAGGLAWLRMEDDSEVDFLRRLMRRFGGGHATLVRASPAVRAAVPAFEPQPPALAALSARLKEQFDPKGILNPGRMG